MKTAAKVFIWIGMIFSFYLIFPIIIGTSALKKLDNATSKKDLGSTPILTLLFCNFIGGIIMFLLDDKDFVNNKISSDYGKINLRQDQEDEVYKTKQEYNLYRRAKNVSTKLQFMSLFFSVVIIILSTIPFVEFFSDRYTNLTVPPIAICWPLLFVLWANIIIVVCLVLKINLKARKLSAMNSMIINISVIICVPFSIVCPFYIYQNYCYSVGEFVFPVLTIIFITFFITILILNTIAYRMELKHVFNYIEKDLPNKNEISDISQFESIRNSDNGMINSDNNVDIDATKKLLELKQLLDMGVLSNEEYELKKKKYIDYL